MSTPHPTPPCTYMPARAMTRAPLRVAIIAGGSGGHLIPGVALAQEFQRLDHDIELRFLIPGKPLERDILEGNMQSYVACGHGPAGQGLLARLRRGCRIPITYRRYLEALKDFAPNVVIGLWGGEFNILGGIAARRLGIPIVMLEQNVIAGRVNRVMARYAQTLFAQWPIATPLHHHAKVEVVGNPVRRSLGRYDPAMARRILGLREDRTTLLVMGGSQGAAAINNFVLSNLSMLETAKDQLQIVHITGRGDYRNVLDRSAHSKLPYRVIPYAPDPGLLFGAADVVLMRAGASTLGELLLLGKPSILVPLPSARDDHQSHNARFVASRGAATIIAQDELADPACLPRLLTEVLLHPACLQEMARAARMLGKPSAGKEIALRIMERFSIQPNANPVESSLDTRVFVTHVTNRKKPPSPSSRHAA